MRLLLISLHLILMLVLAACSGSSDDASSHADTLAGPAARPLLPNVSESRRLVVLIDNSVSSFFVYRGHPAGFEYEMLSWLCREQGWQIDIRVIFDKDALLDSLEAGVGHLAAGNFTITPSRAERMLFSDTILRTHYALVQRKPPAWQRMTTAQMEGALIREVSALDGKTISLREGSSYNEFILARMDSAGIRLNLDYVPGDTDPETILEWVSLGRKELTVMDENLAAFYLNYFDNLDMELKTTAEQGVAWAIGKGYGGLKETVDRWIDKHKGSLEYNMIIKKYFNPTPGSRRKIKAALPEMSRQRISPYDELVRQEASRIGWDWKLVSAQIYQESKFDPKATSWVGAQGLMQLMPATGKEYGARNPFDPIQNVRAGTAYLDWLTERYRPTIQDSAQRQRFVLAAYNAGQGHVDDAMRLAEVMGKQPYRWDGHVDSMMLLLSQRAYYSRPEVRYGYCRGTEPFDYVIEIEFNYRHYESYFVGQAGLRPAPGTVHPDDTTVR